ncbi:hypothetical protein R6Z07F_005887 [Ovis aries]
MASETRPRPGPARPLPLEHHEGQFVSPGCPSDSCQRDWSFWEPPSEGHRCPYHGPIRTALPGLCPPPALGERARRVGRARPSICRAGGRRAGGLGAVCNFAASVAAVPGERAPALAPIGRRRVSWCDLLLSLLAFGHPETNQFDDY